MEPLVRTLWLLNVGVVAYTGNRIWTNLFRDYEPAELVHAVPLFEHEHIDDFARVLIPRNLFARIRKLKHELSRVLLAYLLLLMLFVNAETISFIGVFVLPCVLPPNYEFSSMGECLQVNKLAYYSSARPDDSLSAIPAMSLLDEVSRSTASAAPINTLGFDRFDLFDDLQFVRPVAAFNANFLKSSNKYKTLQRLDGESENFGAVEQDVDDVLGGGEDVLTSFLRNDHDHKSIEASVVAADEENDHIHTASKKHVPSFYHSTAELRSALQQIEGANVNVETRKSKDGSVELDLVHIKPSGSSASTGEKMKAFFVFGEHARELISPESGLHFVRHLTGLAASSAPSSKAQSASALLDKNTKATVKVNAAKLTPPPIVDVGEGEDWMAAMMARRMAVGAAREAAIKEGRHEKLSAGGAVAKKATAKANSTDTEPNSMSMSMAEKEEAINEVGDQFASMIPLLNRLGTGGSAHAEGAVAVKKTDDTELDNWDDEEVPDHVEFTSTANSKSDAKNPMHNLEVVIVLNANPKGRDDVVLGGNLCQRVNEHGIDLNRNYDEHFVASDCAALEQAQGSNKFELANCRDTNAGKKPFSEPETQLINDAVTAFAPDLFVSVHSGSVMMFAPYAYGFEGEDSKPIRMRDEDYLRHMDVLESVDREHHIKAPFGPAANTIHYASPGNSIDYVYDHVRPHAHDSRVRPRASLSESAKTNKRRVMAFAFEIYNGVADENAYLHAKYNELEADYLSERQRLLLANAKDGKTSFLRHVGLGDDKEECLRYFNPVQKSDFDSTLNTWTGVYMSLIEKSRSALDTTYPRPSSFMHVVGKSGRKTKTKTMGSAASSPSPPPSSPTEIQLKSYGRDSLYGPLSLAGKSFSMLFDTGSFYTWVPSVDCDACVRMKKQRLSLPEVMHSPYVFRDGNTNSNANAGEFHLNPEHTRVTFVGGGAVELALVDVPAAALVGGDAKVPQVQQQDVDQYVNDGQTEMEHAYELMQVGLAHQLSDRPFKDMPVDGVVGLERGSSFMKHYGGFGLELRSARGGSGGVASAVEKDIKATAYLGLDDESAGLTAGRAAKLAALGYKADSNTKWVDAASSELQGAWALRLVDVKISGKSVPGINCSVKEPCTLIVDTGSQICFGDAENTMAITKHLMKLSDATKSKSDNDDHNDGHDQLEFVFAKEKENSYESKKARHQPQTQPVLRVDRSGYMLKNAKTGHEAPAFLPNPKGNAKTLIVGLNFLQDKLTVFQDRSAEEGGARVQFVDLQV